MHQKGIELIHKHLLFVCERERERERERETERERDGVRGGSNISYFVSFCCFRL